jgi:hypothetical protein
VIAGEKEGEPNHMANVRPQADRPRISWQEGERRSVRDVSVPARARRKRQDGELMMTAGGQVEELEEPSHALQEGEALSRLD